MKFLKLNLHESYLTVKQISNQYLTLEVHKNIDLKE